MNLNKGMIFAAGAVAGAAVAWYLTRRKYEKLSREEIESVKESFRRESEKKEEPTLDILLKEQNAKKLADEALADIRKENTPEEQMRTATNLANDSVWGTTSAKPDNSFRDIPTEDDEEEEDGPVINDPDGVSEEDLEILGDPSMEIDWDEEAKHKFVFKHPYILTPEQFGEYEDYELITLLYWADGVLTDDNNERITNLNDIIGGKSLTHFGEYEDDTVYVRNDRYKCDYEVLKENRKYREFVKGRRY